MQAVTVVSSDDSRALGEALLRPFVTQPLPRGGSAVGVVVVRGDTRLSDVYAT